MAPSSFSWIKLQTLVFEVQIILEHFCISNWVFASAFYVLSYRDSLLVFVKYFYLNILLKNLNTSIHGIKNLAKVENGNIS